MTTSGTVLDASGAPVPWAGLSVLPGLGMGLEVRSDDAGKYSITWQNRNVNVTGARVNSPQTHYRLTGRDLDHESVAMVEMDGKSTNVDLHLQPGITLSGLVREAGGQPVPNALVELLLPSTGDRESLMNREQLAWVNAGPQGAFSFSSLPQGTPCVVAVAAGGYGTNWSLVPAGDTRTNRLQLPPLVLKPANRQLAGQVVGSGQQADSERANHRAR